MGLWRVTLYQAFRAKWGKERKRERIEGVDIVTYQNQGIFCHAAVVSRIYIRLSTPSCGPGA